MTGMRRGGMSRGATRDCECGSDCCRCRQGQDPSLQQTRPSPSRPVALRFGIRICPPACWSAGAGTHVASVNFADRLRLSFMSWAESKLGTCHVASSHVPDKPPGHTARPGRLSILPPRGRPTGRYDRCAAPPSGPEGPARRPAPPFPPAVRWRLAVGNGEVLDAARRGGADVVGVTAVDHLPPPGPLSAGDERGVRRAVSPAA